MPELTEQQQAALPVIEWLFSPNDEDRRTGRSTVMALAYIRLAMSNPGRWVEVLDHYPMRGGMNVVYDAIHEMSTNLGLQGIFLHERGRSGYRLQLPSNFYVSEEVEQEIFSINTREDLERPFIQSQMNRIVTDIQRSEDERILKELDSLAKKAAKGLMFRQPPPRPKTIWDHLTDDSMV